MMRWDSFVSVVPEVQDVFDDDGERGQGAKGDRHVCHNRVGDNVRDEETACGATDSDAEVADGIMEVVHGLNHSVGL